MDRRVLARFLKNCRPLILMTLFCSAAINIIAFAGSVYMLAVYDVVLPSRSVETLLGFFVILIIVYVFQGLFEVLRGEVFLSLALRVYRDLAPVVHDSSSYRRVRAGTKEGEGQQSQRDLDQLFAYLSGPGPGAMLDLPWVVVFLAVLFMVHWWLGMAACCGAVILGFIAWLSGLRAQQDQINLSTINSERHARLQTEMRFAESVYSLGMRRRMLERTLEFDFAFLKNQEAVGRILGRWGVTGRIFRTFVQSLLLTVGAFLVIRGAASGGIIIASSILAGRALAPIDHAIANWRSQAGALASWKRIFWLLSTTPVEINKSLSLPPPDGELVVQDVSILVPGGNLPLVSGVSFRIEPGQALAIMGPSASGKTTLAKAILGIWPVGRGEIRIGGATHGQWDSDELGRSIGYVAQTVDILPGTIAENISRFDPAPNSDAIIAASKAARFHNAILRMANGYETLLSIGATELSAGERQRIGLARALYGEPHLVVLDEANSNLDAEGEAALVQSILDVRSRGGIVIQISHRPAAFTAVSHIAVLVGGRLADFGEREEVLRRYSRQQMSRRIPEVV